jgi:hypothetical protein
VKAHTCWVVEVGGIERMSGATRGMRTIGMSFTHANREAARHRAQGRTAETLQLNKQACDACREAREARLQLS